MIMFSQEYQLAVWALPAAYKQHNQEMHSLCDMAVIAPPASKVAVHMLTVKIEWLLSDLCMTCGKDSAS